MTDNYYKATDQILTVDHRFRPRGRDWEDMGTFTYTFDFEFRTMTVSRYQANTFTSDTHPSTKTCWNACTRSWSSWAASPTPFPVRATAARGSLQSPRKERG